MVVVAAKVVGLFLADCAPRPAPDVLWTASGPPVVARCGALVSGLHTRKAPRWDGIRRPWRRMADCPP